MEVSFPRLDSHAPTLRSNEQLERAGVFAFGLLTVALSAGFAGGVRPTASGWMAVVMLWVAAVALVLRDRLEFGRLDLAFLGGLGAFTAWVALSLLWTSSITSTVHEIQHDLAYVGLVAATLLLVRRVTVSYLLGGVLSGITALSAYALATRLFPERYGDFETTLDSGYRLAGPITSWNALASFAAIGFLLAFGFAARGGHPVARALAAACLPTLALTMYFTFSRSAWLALAAGLLVLAAVDARRLQLVAAALLVVPWSVFAVLAASRQDGLVSVDTTLDIAARDGRTFVWAVLGLSAVSAAAAVLFAVLERRVVVPASFRLVAAGIIVVVALGGLTSLWIVGGSPERLARDGWNSFNSPPTSADDLTDRLFDLSSNGRLAYWRVSWHRFEQRPVLGEGAGTYWQMYAADRTSPGYTKQGHNLYLETMAELGAPGILLLIAALSVPFVAAVRARKLGLVPPALAAFAAFLTHAAVDPDWELAGVTAAGLLIAAGIVIAARPEGEDGGRLRPGRRVRLPIATGLIVLAAAAFIVLMGDIRLASAQTARENENPTRALVESRRAAYWARWSAEPDAATGDAYAQLGDKARARVAYRRALERDPNNWFLWQALAPLLTGAERAEAIATLEQLNPIDAKAVRNPPQLR